MLTSVLLTRIAARAGVAFWHHRIALVVAALAVGVLGSTGSAAVAGTGQGT